MKEKETKNSWLRGFGIICVILGITSFSNHPNWGKAITLFGAVLVCIVLLKKIWRKVKV